MSRMDRMWERLARTRVMCWAIDAVDGWFDRTNGRQRRLEEAEDSTPAHGQTDHRDHTYLFLYRVVTSGQWTRNGTTPATCIKCLNDRDLALTWVTGHENRARFTCPCRGTWSDPLWASKAATEHVLDNTHMLPWVELDPRFDEEHQHLDLTVLQMRYEADAAHRRRQQEEDEQ